MESNCSVPLNIVSLSPPKPNAKMATSSRSKVVTQTVKWPIMKKNETIETPQRDELEKTTAETWLK